MSVMQSPQKAEAGKLGVQGQPWLHNEFKFSLGYMWPCTKRKRGIIFQSLIMRKWSTPEKFRDISQFSQGSGEIEKSLFKIIQRCQCFPRYPNDMMVNSHFVPTDNMLINRSLHFFESTEIGQDTMDQNLQKLWRVEQDYKTQLLGLSSLNQKEVMLSCKVMTKKNVSGFNLVKDRECKAYQTKSKTRNKNKTCETWNLNQSDIS